ncbi:MAG: M20 family metallo-hydrolase, partial [Desulfatiglandales bacterium]
GFRPNLLADYGNPDTKRRIVILSHADIVPPGDLNLWASDPFELQVQGDSLVGRGVEDNNHGFVSSYIALKAILESGAELKNRVTLAVVSDEETGSDYGLKYVLKTRPELFSKEDLIVVPDGGNEDGTMVEVAEKSMLWLKIEIKGRQCHASTPHKGINALEAMAGFICELKALRERYDQENPLFSPPRTTIEPTKVLANVPNINTVPGLQVFYLDSRVLPEQELDHVIASLREIAEKVSKGYGVEVWLEPVLKQKAAPPTPPESPVVKALLKAIEEVLGLKGRPQGIGGGTVAAFFREKGYPAAVWCTSEDTAHQPNESCKISTILRDAKVFAYLYLL